MKIGCIPNPYLRHFGAKVYFERVDKSVVVLVDTFMHNGLDVVVYDPELKDMVGAECSTKSYLPKGAPVSCKPMIVNLWKTGNSDVLTDIVVERMIAATQPNTQLTYSRDGFIQLTKKNKHFALRHSPRIFVCDVGNGRDSEVEAIASICQVMVEGTDLFHDTRTMKCVIDPAPYGYSGDCYHENIATIIDALLDTMDFDENVYSVVEKSLYAIMSDMYITIAPEKHPRQDEGWYE